MGGGASKKSAPSAEAMEMSAYAMECKLRSMFRRFDLDGDGHISINEVEAMIRSLTDGAGLGSPDWDKARQVSPQEDAEFIVEALDEDKNGQIEEEEWVGWIKLGLSREIKTRKEYAKKNDRNHRLENFLGIIESIPAEEVDQTLISAVTKEQMEKVFESFDNDKDGKITLEELKSMLTELKLRTSIGTGSIQSDKEDAQTLMDALDDDNNGTVEKSEFVEWVVRGIGRPLRARVAWANKSVRNRRLDHFLRAVTETASGSKQRGEFRRHLRKIFVKFDLDNDGHIVQDELVAMMTEIRLTMSLNTQDVSFATQDAAAVIQAMDSDGNGRIEEDEFVNWMNDGLSIPMSRREAFASKSDFNRRTASFLGSVEAYIKRVLLLEPDNQAMIRMRLRKVFQRYDKDGDGNIQQDEAQAMVNEMLNVGPQNDDPIFKSAGTKMINALDYTGDGAIDEDEFVQWVTTGMTRTQEERATFSVRGPVNVLLLRLLDSITDECLSAKVTVGEVKKEKLRLIQNQAKKDSQVRSATNISASDGAIDINDDEFAIGEIEEMSFGGSNSSFSFAAGSSGETSSNSTKKNNKQALINIYGKYDIKNTGDMDTPTFRRMCIDLITEATCVSEDQVREFNDETTLGVLVAALDMDGDGAVQKDEFVSWIMSGMNRSKNDRERFAKKNQLNERLEMFLQAVEEVVAKA